MLGNPTTYRGKALSWTKAKRLASFGNNTFLYGADGIRFQKNNTVYTLDGSNILEESDGENTITYYYGVNGIIGFNYCCNDYYYRKNLQGDIVEICNAEGAKVASYLYDAWGKLLEVNNYTSENIGTVNPFRYRGYYYDVETGLYYLNSRYYDPDTGRFISCDSFDVIATMPMEFSDKNLYIYCDNNPVMRADDGGEFWHIIAGAAIGATINFVASVVSELVEQSIDPNHKFDWGGVLISTAIGAAEGALIATCPGAAGIISAGASATDSLIDGIRDGDSAREIAINTIVSGAIGFVAGSGGGNINNGKDIINSAVACVGNTFKKGIHPAVKKAARKTLRKAAKHLGKTVAEDLGSVFVYGGLSEGFSWVVEKAIDRVYGD